MCFYVSSFFLDKDNRCKPCASSCSLCASETNCLKCDDNKLLHNGKCVDKCPVNFYENNNQCSPCHPTCATCTGPEKTDCLTCDIGFKYFKKECQSECPEGTYFDLEQRECELCNATACKWCIKTANTCTRCDSSLALDPTTFTCRPCCTRSIRGKIKYPTCCNCPSENFNGMCLLPNQTENYNVIIEFLQVNKSSTTVTGLSVFIIILALAIYLASAYLFRRNWLSKKRYGDIEYSVLSDPIAETET
jgi:hypothetical protein